MSAECGWVWGHAQHPAPSAGQGLAPIWKPRESETAAASATLTAAAHTREERSTNALTEAGLAIARFGA